LGVAQMLRRGAFAPHKSPGFANKKICLMLADMAYLTRQDTEARIRAQIKELEARLSKKDRKTFSVVVSAVQPIGPSKARVTMSAGHLTLVWDATSVAGHALRAGDKATIEATETGYRGKALVIRHARVLKK
jgi:hypothetical protein